MLILATNPLIEAYKQSDLFGKGIFIALFFLSCLTWLIFLNKWRSQREMNKKGVIIQETFEKRKNNPLSLDFQLMAHPFSKIYSTLKLQSIELLNKNSQLKNGDQKVYLSRSDIDFIDANLGQTISNQIKGLEKNLFILSTIVSLAPFLGLLGTVWGILVTFSHLQNGSFESAHGMVMNGLAMALGTTVIGLLVAIPALIAYNYLKASIAHFACDLEDFSHLILGSIELNYRKVDLN